MVMFDYMGGCFNKHRQRNNTGPWHVNIWGNCLLMEKDTLQMQVDCKHAWNILRAIEGE